MKIIGVMKLFNQVRWVKVITFQRQLLVKCSQVAHTPRDQKIILMEVYLITQSLRFPMVLFVHMSLCLKKWVWCNGTWIIIVSLTQLSAAGIRAWTEWFLCNSTVYSQQLIAQLSIMYWVKQDVLPHCYCVSWSYKRLKSVEPDKRTGRTVHSQISHEVTQAAGY